VPAFQPDDELSGRGVAVHVGEHEGVAAPHLVPGAVRSGSRAAPGELGRTEERGEIHLVLAPAEIGDHVERRPARVGRRGRRVEDENVLALAAGQSVCAGTPDEHIVALAAVEPVVSFAAGEKIVALAAVELVVARAAVEFVVAGAAEEFVVSLAAVELVVAGAAEQHVVALAAEEFVVPLAPVELVVAGAAEQHVVSAAPEDRVRTVRADEHVVALASFDLRLRHGGCSIGGQCARLCKIRARGAIAFSGARGRADTHRRDEIPARASRFGRQASAADPFTSRNALVHTLCRNPKESPRSRCATPSRQAALRRARSPRASGPSSSGPRRSAS
jgi:hypothetical protein